MPQKLKRKKPPDEVLWIGQVGLAINRRPGTIRKWLAQGRLPDELLPARYEKNNRYYWTQKQVDGILQWMKDNDIRPGPMFTDPADEARAIANMRQPKYLNGYHIKSARTWAESGKSREYIINKLMPRTQYVNSINLARALDQVAEDQGWKMPRAQARKTQAVQRETKRLQKLANKAEALTKGKK